MIDVAEPYAPDPVYRMGLGKSASNQQVRKIALKVGAVCCAPRMRHFRPPLFALAVLVVASLCSGIIQAQSLRGPTQDDVLVIQPV
jgi:hypothetical protein